MKGVFMQDKKKLNDSFKNFSNTCDRVNKNATFREVTISDNSALGETPLIAFLSDLLNAIKKAVIEKDARDKIWEEIERNQKLNKEMTEKAMTEQLEKWKTLSKQELKERGLDENGVAFVEKYLQNPQNKESCADLLSGKSKEAIEMDKEAQEANLREEERERAIQQGITFNASDAQLYFGSEADENKERQEHKDEEKVEKKDSNNSTLKQRPN